MGDWFSRTPIWLLGIGLFLVTVAAAYAGWRLSRWFASNPGRWGQLTESQEGYIITTVYTLLGLLVGFTFSIAVDRYQDRRELVIRDATSIEQLYLRAQLLDEPHRTRFSNLLVRYAENHLALAKVRHDDIQAKTLIAEDQLLQQDLWTATVPAFQNIRTLDFSSSFVDSVNDVIRTDAERQAARRAQIPRTVILLLIFYSIVAAALLGAIMKSRKGEIASVFLLALSVLALMLITDMNRPVEGTIHEPQEPMERMLARLKASPPAVYQRLAMPPH